MKIPSLIPITKTAMALLTVFAMTTQHGSSAMVEFGFDDTTLPGTVGPLNPANGPTSINGSSLTAGDTVVFDGIIVLTGTSGNTWGAVELNAGGFLGITAPAMGVLVRSSGTENTDLYVNGAFFFNLISGVTATSNRIRIEIYISQTGSTTNVGWQVQMDQGLTGSFAVSTSGTNLTFANNTIALTFAAANAQHLFIQNTPVVSAIVQPAAVTVALGQPASFNAVIRGFPRSTEQRWRRNGVLIPDATNTTYTTPATTLGDNGASYDLVVTNLFNPANVAIATPGTLQVRSTPGLVTFDFPDTQVNVGAPAFTDSGEVIDGSYLLAGDTLVFDAYLLKTGAGDANGFVGVDLQGAGYAGVTAASLGALVRMAGVLPCELFTNGVAGPNFAPSGSPENRLRIELYPSATGSTTNMGYSVKVDQGITGTFLPAVTGTNLTFTNNTIPLVFGDHNTPAVVIQNPQPVSIYSGPSPAAPSVSLGSSVALSVIAKGWNPAYQWRKNGATILGATNRNYTVPRVSLADDGAQFSVVVSNRLDSMNVVTSSVAVIEVSRTTPGIITFDFPETQMNVGAGTITDPGVAIDGSFLLAGDTVVFDGYVLKTGSGDTAGFVSVNVGGGGYANVTAARLGALLRIGTGACQLWANGISQSDFAPTGSPTNRLRIELYPSTTGSTTNMGWSVKVDQGITGTFLPAVTGTNLTFPNNTLPLTFGDHVMPAVIVQNPSDVSIYAGPSPAVPTVTVGSSVTLSVIAKGWNPAYQWRKNGATIFDATNRNYALPPVTLGDDGAQFSVVVSNRLDSLNVVTSSVAVISVRIPNNLTWNPTVDLTTWNGTIANWTTNGGTSQTTFTDGDNVIFDSLGFGIGGNFVTVTNPVVATAMAVEVTGGNPFTLTGAGNVSAQTLAVSGDGTAVATLQTLASFNSATISAAGELHVGGGGFNGAFQASHITNNGTIQFNNDGAGGDLVINGRITGPGVIVKSGTSVAALSATDSAYTIGSINAGALEISSSPNPGAFVNNGLLRINSPINLTIANDMSGAGAYFLSGSGNQIHTFTGTSTHTGGNQLWWARVLVDNPQALGDAESGFTFVSGADRLSGLYLSNNITWTQPLALQSRLGAPFASAIAAHIGNLSGSNVVAGPLLFQSHAATDPQINVEASAGILVIESDVANSAVGTNTLNLQGAGLGVWNGDLANGAAGTDVLNVLKRGTGTWLLNGANTYSGTTTISGGVLGGNGTIAGPVLVSSGGVLAPGASIGTLTINNSLNLVGTVLTEVTVISGVTNADKVVGLTGVNYGGTLVITNTGATPLTAGMVFDLFDGAAGTGNFNSIVVTPEGLSGTFNPATGEVTLTASTAPQLNYTNLGNGVLQFQWSGPYKLVWQTNSLSVGLTSSGWMDYPVTSNPVLVTNNLGIPTAFFGLQPQ